MIAVLSTARKAISRGAVLASCLWLAACDASMMGPLGNSGSSSGPQIDTNAPVQVALLVPQSDPGAGYRRTQPRKRRAARHCAICRA